VQYYNVRLKGILKGKSATAIVALEKGTMLDRGKCERYTGCAVVQYYNLRLKCIGNGAAATEIAALEKREQC
jgi:hypothetical protein